MQTHHQDRIYSGTLNSGILEFLLFFHVTPVLEYADIILDDILS